MSKLPKISTFKAPAKTFIQIIILIIVVAVFYALFKSLSDFFVKSRIDTRKAYIETLQFDYKVTRVVDGDTVEVKRLDGENVLNLEEKVKVRLIGINSPESVDPRRPVECFGKEAKAFMKDLAEEKVAAIEIDPSQAKVDKYGRLLAYIFIKNSGVKGENVVFINEEALKEGYAYEYTYEYPYKYKQNFKSLEAIARANKLGLWNVNTCNGLKTPVAPPVE